MMVLLRWNVLVFIISRSKWRASKLHMITLLSQSSLIRGSSICGLLYPIFSQSTSKATSQYKPWLSFVVVCASSFAYVWLCRANHPWVIGLVFEISESIMIYLRGFKNSLENLKLVVGLKMKIFFFTRKHFRVNESMKVNVLRLNWRELGAKRFTDVILVANIKL